MAVPAQILFLPGASGNTDFWKPVADLLRQPAAHVEHVGWPGFGQTPADPSVTSLPDLVQRVVARIDRPTVLVAQSMGGVVAILGALAKSGLVSHLIITALSGGLDVRRHGARDWRPPREKIDLADPAHMFAAYDEDLSPLLPSLAIPTLLLWGDEDPVSPVAVGKCLAELLPCSTLHVIKGGTHVLAQTRAEEVARLIERHLVADR